VQAIKVLASKANGDIRSCLNTLQLLAARHTRILPQHVHDTAFGQKDLTAAPLEVLDSLLLARKRRCSDMYSSLVAFGEHSLVRAAS
jgi:DNA polymerase III delta prime subunit